MNPVQVLVRAFAEDPLARWMLPEGIATDRVFGPVVEESAGHGELSVSADGAAVAVWLPRGAEPPPVPDLTPLPAELDRLRTFLTVSEQRHPTGRAHLYLVFLGVLPQAQGRGHGGALLRDRLARADAAGLPAYLEASSPRNLPLYERHGFRPDGDPISLPDGPQVWPMWREPHRRTS
jgi:GNAT superfamily N-acetyltransferase